MATVEGPHLITLDTLQSLHGYPVAAGNDGMVSTRASRIRDLFATIGSEANLRDDMISLVHKLVELFDAKTGCIRLFEQERAIPSASPLAEFGDLEEQAPYWHQMQSESSILIESRASIAVSLNTASKEIDWQRDASEPVYAVLSPISAGEALLGVVTLICHGQANDFSAESLHLLDSITLYTGQALYARRLRDVLDSRLLGLVLGADVDRAVKHVRNGSVPALDKMTRIVAKSFYREMARAGFGSHQIIRAATEIISELHRNLQKRCAVGAN